MNQKTLSILAVALLFNLSLLAQNRITTSKKTTDEHQPSYLGLGTGINSVGLIGLIAEVPLSQKTSVRLGAGIGGWGVKALIGAKFYRNYPTSWGFGAGYSMAGGLKNFDFTINNNGSTQIAKMNLNRAHMLDLTAYKGWGNKVRFNLELGYSARVGGGTYAPVDKTVILSKETTQVLNIQRPGGLIIGLGLTFRL